MPTHKGVGKRIEALIFALTSQKGERVTLAAFGKLVAEAEGRAEPYTSGAVSQWIGETNEPKLATFVAMGVVMGQHPSYIAFGDAPAAQEYNGSWRRAEDVAAENEARRANSQEQADKHAPKRRAKPA